MNEPLGEILLGAAERHLGETLPASEDMGKEARRFNRIFWPFLDPYQSPVASGFSYERRFRGQAAAHEVRLLRDGAIPLAWFFHRGPEPSPSSGRILVHRSLAEVVPDNWWPRVDFFQFYAERNFHRQAPPRNLVLAGAVNPMNLRLEELEHLLVEVCAEVDLGRLENVYVYCPVRRVKGVATEEETFAFEVHRRLHQTFGKKLRFPHWNWCELTDWEGLAAAYVELNAGWLYKDSAACHRVLSRGAGLLGAPAASNGTRIPFSRFHGIEILPPRKRGPVGKRAPDRSLLSFYTAMHGKEEGGSPYPWPRWFHGYARALVEETKGFAFISP